MPIVPVAALSAVVFAFVNFLKAVKNTDWNAVVTQLAAWVAGWAATVLAAHSAWAGNISFNGVHLDDINGMSQLFLGLILAAFAHTFNEQKKARDNTDTAAKPPLLGHTARREHVVVTETPVQGR